MTFSTLNSTFLTLLTMSSPKRIRNVVTIATKYKTDCIDQSQRSDIAFEVNPLPPFGSRFLF